MSLVSVIIPTYNRADFIEKCISSVAKQTYRPIEIIVVDDGSTDNTNQVLARIGENLCVKQGLTLSIVGVSNGGVARARNIGMSVSKGEWIQFLDSDDLLLPHRIETVLALATELNVDMVYSKSQYIDETGCRLDRFLGRSLDGSDKDYFEFSWQTMCPLYSRNALEKIGDWNENLTMHVDWEFCIRGVLAGLNIHFIDSVDSLYRVHSEENIGSHVSINKNRSREIALWSIYSRLNEKRLLSPYLASRFRSRLFYILLYYYRLNDPIAAFLLAKRMARENLLNPLSTFVLRRLPMGLVSKTVLYLYDA